MASTAELEAAIKKRREQFYKEKECVHGGGSEGLWGPCRTAVHIHAAADIKRLCMLLIL